MTWLFLPGRRNETPAVATRLVSPKYITIHSTMIEREGISIG